MIRTQIHGASIFIIAVFLISCSPLKEIQNRAVVLEDYYYYYIIDSLSFSYRFGGNFDRISNREKIRNNLRKDNLNHLPVRNCIDGFKTWSNSAWHNTTHYNLYFPNSKKQIHNNLLNAIKKDTNDFYIDANHCIVGKFVPLENNKGSIYIIGHSNKEGFNTLKLNYTNIFNSLITNEKYRKISFTQPFELAREREFYEDSTVNYLTPVYLLKKREQNYTDVFSKYNWLQSYGTFMSRLTSEQKEIQKSVHKFSNFNNSRENFVSSENVLHINDAALSYLVQKCKNERVVMINENHFAPHHRMLGEIIIDSLYNYGFRYLAMEAIWENDTALNERGFATTNTGLYSREPMMANLIRKAIEKGYSVFGYDDFTNEREKNQAINIYQKTLVNDSICKVLVWSGFGHINEEEKSKRMMAREFFLLTGIDPLTINQTSFVTEEEKYLMVLDTTTLKNRKITCDIFVANNINYDMFAVKSDFKNYNITIPKEIAKQVKKNPLTFIVSIFKTSEYQKDKTAIPIYNHALNNKLFKISIKLPDSDYYYIIRHRYGKIVYQSNL